MPVRVAAICRKNFAVARPQFDFANRTEKEKAETYDSQQLYVR